MSLFIAQRAKHGLHLISLICLFVAGTGLTPGQQPKDTLKSSPPKVMIVVTGDYKNGLAPLTHAVDSAVSLGIELRKIGYDVQFLAGSESAKKVKDGVSKNTSAAKISVREANDGKALFSEIKLWMGEFKGVRCPLAFLVLIGHGEQRFVNDTKGKESVAFLLGRDDVPGEGGLSVKELRDEAGRFPLPLTIIYDACRLEAKAAGDQPKLPRLKIVDVDGKEVPPPVSAQKQPSSSSDTPWTPSQLDRRNGVVSYGQSPDRDKLPTIVYSAQLGKVASDKEDLVGALAKGISSVDEIRNTLMGVDPEIKTRPSLTLHHWLLYGVVNVVHKSNLKQTHEIVMGIVPLNTPVATFSERKLVAPTRQFVMLDLRDSWSPVWGDFQSEYDRDSGYRVVHPATGTAQGRSYRGGSLGGADGFDVTAGRVLVLDLIATKAPGHPAKTISCEIHALHKANESAVPTYMCRDSKVYTFLFDRVVTAKIPVFSPSPKGPVSVNGLALSTNRASANSWPRGTTITILDMRLESRLEKMVFNPEPSLDPKVANILPMWMPLNPVPDKAPLLLATLDKRGLVLRQRKPIEERAVSHCGADLLNPVYVSTASELVVDTQNSSKKAAELRFELLSISGKGDALESKALIAPEGRSRQVPPGKSKLRIPLSGPGWAHYLAVGSDCDSDVVLSGLIIMPK